MQKCVKVSISGVHDRESFYKICKKSLKVDAIEGIVQPNEEDEIIIIVHGPKEAVDALVITVDEVASKYAEEHEQEIGFFVEPFFKEENYRGLFRFIKNEASSSA